MTQNLHCPMIHGGLNINLKANDGTLAYNQCCLSSTPLISIENPVNLWDSRELANIREQNNNNIWNKNCWECERLENAGHRSFRQAMIDKFGIKKNPTGPQRIDLLFDRSCNLACTTCGPGSSTFWYKHLKDNNLPVETYSNPDNLTTITNTLKAMDLSNLEMIQFCGGETLLGNTYWRAAELIAELVPDANNKLVLAFQTNGTQSIDEKYYKIIEKFHLVKFMISIDGTHDKFEYLRWPASWNQVVDNIMSMREKLPVNVMFFIQETTSCLNLFYHNEVPDWVRNNFGTNRLGDPTEHSTQLVMHNHYDVNNITHEYVTAIEQTGMRAVLQENFKENPGNIMSMLAELNKFDNLRNQDWKQTFPEVAEFYKRYL